MKSYWALCILTVVAFGTLTISTAKIEIPFDGNNTYGFPLIFLIKLGGRRCPIPANWAEIFYFQLLIDIMFAFLLAVVIWTVYVKLKKKVQEKKSGPSSLEQN